MNDIETACAVLVLMVLAWAICDWAWESCQRFRKDTDDSFYSDPAMPRMVETSPDAPAAKDVRALAGDGSLTASTGVEVVARDYYGTTQLTLVRKKVNGHQVFRRQA